MNQCLNGDLTSANIANFPFIENFANFKEVSEDDTNPLKNLSPTKSGKNCSSPSKDRGSNENQLESNLEQKLDFSEDGLTNRPKLHRSTEKLRDFLLSHADFLDSLYEKPTTAKSERDGKVKELPAEMWWAPPYKLPTSSRSVPSVAMSAEYSGISSASCHSKNRRSVEELRQRVDSVCNLVEAMGIVNAEQEKEPEEDGNSNPQTPTRSATWSIPILKFPSTAPSQQSSKRGTDLKNAAHKSVGSQCTIVEPQSNSPSPTPHIETGSATLRLHTGPPTKCTSISPTNNIVDIASTQQKAPSNYEIPHTSLSVSDLACIHIVNPMLSKLARLCTAQGQQYLTVLEELEKSCNDFHNACKYHGATK